MAQHRQSGTRRTGKQRGDSQPGAATLRTRADSHLTLLPYLRDFRRYVLEEIRGSNMEFLPTDKLNALRRLVRSFTELRWRTEQQLGGGRMSATNARTRQGLREMNDARDALDEKLRGLGAVQPQGLEVDVLAELALQATNLAQMKRADVALQYALDRRDAARSVRRMWTGAHTRGMRILEREEQKAPQRRGGPIAARKRHAKSEERNLAWRDEYQRRLRQAKQQHPRESIAALSPKIIAEMARTHKKTRRYMRVIVKPRQQQKM